MSNFKRYGAKSHTSELLLTTPLTNKSKSHREGKLLTMEHTQMEMCLISKIIYNNRVVLSSGNLIDLLHIGAKP